MFNRDSTCNRVFRVHESLQKILNIRLDESAWSQSTLPINMGGLGLKLATEVALPAFSSSSTVKAMIPLSYQDDHNPYYTLGCTEWMNKLGTNNLPDNPIFQSEWDKPL